MESYIKIKDYGILKHVMDIYKSTTNDLVYVHDLIAMLRPVKITLIMETNRLQSLYLCELLQSYSIQSQRYCRYDLDIFKNTIFENYDIFSDDEKKKIDKVLNNSLDLYFRMTRLKEGSENKTKFTNSDFMYDIPIDDARYILPLAFKCNCEMTIDGECLLKLLALLYNNENIMGNLYEQLADQVKYITDSDFIVNLSKRYTLDDGSRIVNKKYIEYFFGDRHIEKNHKVKLINPKTSIDPMKKSGVGALLCTTYDKSPDEIMESKNIDEFKNITERVSYNTKHTSIIEHSTFNFIASCSIPCYNQFIRHRHQQAVREKFDLEFISNEYMPFIYPDSIENSKFKTEVHNLIDEITNLISDIYNKSFINYSEYSDITTNIKLDAITQIIPMGYELRILWSTNLLNELYKASKRTCMKAHWEIRNITHEILELIKYKIGSDNKLLNFAKPGCCTKQGCPEGKFTCNNNYEVLKLFNIK